MEILILLVLILINGFFSLSEIALVSSKETRLEQYRQNGSKGALIALKLRSNSGKFLSSVQVGITLISLITGAYGGMSIAREVTPLFERFESLRPYADGISMVVIMFLITYVSIVIGELVPKTIALSNPEKIAVRVAPFINFFSKLFYPFVKLLSSSTTFVTKLMGVEKQTEHLTESELRHMIKTASIEGVIEKEQNEIHEKVFYFSDKKPTRVYAERNCGGTDRIFYSQVHDNEGRRVSRNNVHSSAYVCKICFFTLHRREAQLLCHAENADLLN